MMPVRLLLALSLLSCAAVARPVAWRTYDTAHFRVFYEWNAQQAMQAAAGAEETFQQVNRKWFGDDGEVWRPRCEIIIHGDGNALAAAANVASSTPAVTTFWTSNDGVFHRRVDLRTDAADMISAILPHETTHAVIARRFGPHIIPKWADEGMAVLSEPRAKIDAHAANLKRIDKQGQLFRLSELLPSKGYLTSRGGIPAFFAHQNTNPRKTFVIRGFA